MGERPFDVRLMLNSQIHHWVDTIRSVTLYIPDSHSPKPYSEVSNQHSLRGALVGAFNYMEIVTSRSSGDIQLNLSVLRLDLLIS
jgi:hypothetical protein